MQHNHPKIYGVLGFPLKHSFSPKLHNYWFRKLKINATYKKFEVSEKKIKELIKKIKLKKIYGLNVTVPYKLKIIKKLNWLNGDARFTRSANTIFYKNNKLIGENTDVYGFERGFLKKIKNIKKKTALILGAGGVVSSIVLALKRNKIKKIIICNRTLKKIYSLKKRFKINFQVEIWKNRNKQLNNADIIINATSLGMKNKPSLILDVRRIKPKSVYCEIVYNPLKTKVIKQCLKRGIKTLNGLDMFIFQAARSFYFWHKKKTTLNLKEKKLIFKNLK